MKLSHVLEMLEEESTIIIGDSADLIPALVSIEAQLHFLGFNVSGLLRKHKVESSLLVH